MFGIRHDSKTPIEAAGPTDWPGGDPPDLDGLSTSDRHDAGGEPLVAALGCVRQHRPMVGSARTAELAARFGLSDQVRPIELCSGQSIELRRGELIAIVGPSGAGKSSALQRIAEQSPTSRFVDRVELDERRALIDCVAPESTLEDAGALLTACGLGEPALWLRSAEALSEGQRFRARLARGIALHARSAASAPLLCDEFCSSLHTRAALGVSYNLRKLTERLGLRVVVATGREELLTDLRPDTLVRVEATGRANVTRPPRRRRMPFSLLRSMVIEQGFKRDYEPFAEQHYRCGDELGFVDKVFVLRERRTREALGVVVYAHGPLELGLRNQATEKRFVRNPQALNRQVRILRRLVIHPDVRGCGLGRHLVRKTMPLVGTEYVECLAGLGLFTTVFVNAGMTPIGQCRPSPRTIQALAALRQMDVDPLEQRFEQLVARRPAVQRIVAGVVRDWYAATTGGGEQRVARQSPELLARLFRGLLGSTPTYYLWSRSRRTAAARRTRKRASRDAATRTGARSA